MYFFTIFTYDPAKRNEIITRRVEQGTNIPPGVKMHGEWSAIGGGRVLRLIETDDHNAALQATLPWSDLGKIEVVPVAPTEDVLNIAKSR